MALSPGLSPSPEEPARESGSGVRVNYGPPGPGPHRPGFGHSRELPLFSNGAPDACQEEPCRKGTRISTLGRANPKPGGKQLVCSPLSALKAAAPGVGPPLAAAVKEQGQFPWAAGELLPRTVRERWLMPTDPQGWAWVPIPHPRQPAGGGGGGGGQARAPETRGQAHLGKRASERKDRPDSLKSGPGATLRKDRTRRLTLSVSPCAAPSSPITVLLLGQSAHCHFREAHVPQTGPSPSTHLLPRLPDVLPTTVTWTAFLAIFIPL